MDQLTSTTGRMRVGLVGGGPWARTVHAPALVGHPDAELAGVWTRRPEVAADLASTFGTRPYPGFDALLADVDAVAFAVPPAVQGELAVHAASTGRHLICEKPLADTVAAARSIVETVAAAGVVTSMVLTLRHDEQFRSWLAALPPGPLGPDTVGSGRWLSGALLGGPYAASVWRGAEGALLDLGPHVIDLLDAALGRVERVEWAHRAEPDLTRFGLAHVGGARSTVMLSIRLPVDPSEIEFALFGRTTARLAARPADAVSCYRRLVGELAAAVRGTGPAPALDAAHGLRLQQIVAEVARLAT